MKSVILFSIALFEMVFAFCHGEQQFSPGEKALHRHKKHVTFLELVSILAVHFSGTEKGRNSIGPETASRFNKRSQ